MLGLAVMALIAAVVTMHSLGFDHALTATSSPAGVGHEMAHDVDPQPQTDTGWSPCPACTAVLSANSRHGGGDMDAMCLAALPLFFLLLLMAVRARTDNHDAAALAARLSSLVLAARAPPGPHLRPSLSKLCILRT